MLLKELIQDVPVAAVEGTLERDVTGLAYDSRRITPGMVFVAISGQNVDGHDFITAALERGAAAVICERNGILFPRATKIRVTDSREALARASLAFYQNPSAKLKVV